MAAVGGTDELTEARGKLRAAEEELSDAKKELVASKADRDAPRIAEAKVGVAEAKVGVAEAKVGVAEAKWQAAPGEKEKDRLWTLVQCAQAAVEALRPVAQHHGTGAHPAAGDTTFFGQFLDEQRRRDEEQQRREEEKEQKREEEQRRRDEEQQRREEEKERKREEEHESVMLSLATSRTPSVHGSITPSSAAQGRENEFYTLLDQMELPWPPDVSDTDHSADQRNNFNFNWGKPVKELATHIENMAMTSEYDGKSSAHLELHVGVGEDSSDMHSADAQEAASYGELCGFLTGLGFDAVIIGNGQGLPGGLLFSTYAHSMRQQGLGVKGQTVYCGMRVYGRTDVVILDDRGKKGEVRRQRVKLGIEVKPQVGKSDDPRSPASREAITQLIGLNINNMQHSPPVLLTNLCRIHWVYYISDHTDFPWFRISRKKFSKFIDALGFIERCLWASEGNHYEFGRGVSPSGHDSVSA